MKSIFNKENNNELIEMINKLTPDTKRQWGKMNVSQMLAHCIVAFRIALGEQKLKRAFIGILFGRLARRMLVNDKSFKKSLATAKEFIINGDKNFDEEKLKLISYVNRFADEGENILTKEAHPFFGKLTTTEWDGLMWKHLDHHLRQFGV